MTVIQAVSVPTTEDILHAQDEGAVEFVDGNIVEKPVSAISSLVARRISLLLGAEADNTGSAWVFEASMGYQCFPDDPRKFRKPDVSVVFSERMKAFPADIGLLPIPADLAVEVNSPNDLVSNVEEKVDEYLNANFGCVWVVDPPTKTVTIHRADGSVTRLRANQEINGESALPTFKCVVAEFFKTPG